MEDPFHLTGIREDAFCLETEGSISVLYKLGKKQGEIRKTHNLADSLQK